jgi:chromosome segregation ATPase
MRIRELTIENFRKFRQLTVLSGFDDGLNLVCEPYGRSRRGGGTRRCSDGAG